MIVPSLGGAMRRAIVLVMSGLLALAPVTSAAAASAFANWAAIVVAGDYHAHDGEPTEAFDNARRDVTRDLVRIGFRPVNIREFSVRPDRYPSAAPDLSEPRTIADGLWDVTDHATGGCLVYFSTHGSPDGIVVGEVMLSPRQLDAIVGNACGTRPTVVVLSACYSGVFVPAMKAPNRFIMTAARADRSSFGCGTDNKYPYFDDCFLRAMPASHGFPDLADRTRTCVAGLERETGMAPPSDPQIFMGTDAAHELPGW